MKILTPPSPSLKRKISSGFLTPTVYAVLLCLFFLVTGCGKAKNETESKPEVTLQNLQTAFNRETRISNEYSLFAEKAEKNRFSAIASLFSAKQKPTA